MPVTVPACRIKDAEIHGTGFLLARFLYGKKVFTIREACRFLSAERKTVLKLLRGVPVMFPIGKKVFALTGIPVESKPERKRPVKKSEAVLLDEMNDDSWLHQRRKELAEYRKEIIRGE